jgi:hypothetical protein
MNDQREAERNRRMESFSIMNAYFRDRDGFFEDLSSLDE